MLIILLFELQRSLCCSIIPSSLAYVISKYDFGEKGGKSDNQSFIQERRHCIGSFLSSDSFYKFNFSAFLCKERSLKQKREFMHLTSSLHDILLCTVYGCSMQHQIQIGFLLIIDTIKGHYDFIIQ